LKAELAKDFITCIQGEKNLDDLLSIQRMNVGKEGIGFVAESSKKKNKKKISMLLLPLRMFHLTFLAQRRSGLSSRARRKSK
jgi:hypothetical protein